METANELSALGIESPGILEAYHDAFIDAIAIHQTSASDRSEVAGMSLEDFDQYVANSRQPLNPITVLREALGLPEGTPTIEIQQSLHEEFQTLLATYEDNGVDGRTAIATAANIIGHTEAYIAGYSRDLGRLTSYIALADPALTAPNRWLEKIWVPQEDAHDRLWSMFLQATDADMERFYKEHARHMQHGIHVPVRAVIPTHLYLTQQEAATVPSYKNTASLLGPVLSKIPRRIRDDEARHAREYAFVASRLMQVAPDETMTALLAEYQAFAMPGREGIADFDQKTAIAGLTGILDPHSILKIQAPILRKLGVEKADLQTDEAKEARDQLLDPSGKYGERKTSQRKRQLESGRQRVIRTAKETGVLLPAIIGLTVEADPVSGELTFPAIAA